MPISGDLDLKYQGAGAGATQEKAALRRMCVSAEVRTPEEVRRVGAGYATPRKAKAREGQRITAYSLSLVSGY